MTYFIRFVLLCLMAGSAFAQSLLTPCQGDVSRWTNCFGTETILGDNYVGEFKDGKRNGQGTLTYANGGKFVGGWLDGLRHGLGTEYRADETIVSSGRWDRGMTVRDIAMQIKAEEEKRLRQEYLDRIRGIVGNNSQLTDVAPPSPLIFRSFSKGYASLLVAQIKPNLTYPEGLSGNPRTEVEVNIDQEGNILNRRIVQSSGFNAWDDAVLKAIDMTVVLPKDTDGRVPPKIIFAFRPYD